MSVEKPFWSHKCKKGPSWVLYAVDYRFIVFLSSDVSFRDEILAVVVVAMTRLTPWLPMLLLGAAMDFVIVGHFIGFRRSCFFALAFDCCFKLACIFLGFRACMQLAGRISSPLSPRVQQLAGWKMLGRASVTKLSTF